ncbi:MAG: tetratricopeptide repeat protein [Gammaproteobacteria bacterium]|nr:tetratricopeptide repeat protein [Gammaproteobacteria bacterium]
MSVIENFEKMLAAGQDSALLRYGLGSAYLQAGDAARAAEHLARAVAQDPAYSAAWKAYGKALAGDGRPDAAAAAYARGIEVAEERGDIQAAKEMKVFLKRLRREADGE